MSHRATPTPTCAHDAARGSILARVTATSASAEPMSAQCPACSLHALVPVHLEAKLGPHRGSSSRQPVEGGMTLDTCPVCFGVWLDAGEIDALGDAEIDPAFLRTLVGQSANRMCPRGPRLHERAHVAVAAAHADRPVPALQRACGSTATSAARWPAARPARARRTRPCTWPSAA
jgi:Zn-finger nucleic acid-binding protein